MKMHEKFYSHLFENLFKFPPSIKSIEQLRQQERQSAIPYEVSTSKSFDDT